MYNYVDKRRYNSRDSFGDQVVPAFPHCFSTGYPLAVRP